ncbi:MAG: hypothetical protein OSA37_00880 [Flavobacteriales bacterium]|nr:hypothetical protein [Flavobacteriales bacterium]
MSLRSHILHSIRSRGWLLLFSTCVILINSRTLGAEGQGEIAWVQLGILLVTGFSGFIAGGAVVYLQQSIPLRSTILPGHIWLLISSVLASLLGVSTGFLPAAYAYDIALLGWLQGIVVFHSQLLLGAQAVVWHNRLQVMQTGLLVTGMVVAYFGWGWQSIDAFLAALLISLACTTVVSTWKLRSLPHIDRAVPTSRVWTLLWKHGSASQSGALLQMLTNRTNFSLLAQQGMGGAAAAGVYSVAFYGLEAIWVAARGLAPVLHTRTAHTSDRQKRIEQTRAFLSLALVITTSLLVVAALIPDDLYTWVFGFGGIQPLIWCLGPAAIAGCKASILAHHLSGIGQHRWNAWTSGLGLIVLIVSASLLIPLHGTVGAALAASLAAIVQTGGLVAGWCQAEKAKAWDLWPQKGDWNIIRRRSGEVE